WLHRRLLRRGLPSMLPVARVANAAPATSSRARHENRSRSARFSPDLSAPSATAAKLFPVRDHMADISDDRPSAEDVPFPIQYMGHTGVTPAAHVNGLKSPFLNRLKPLTYSCVSACRTLASRQPFGG